jgi:D-3-phosphoglycerate dehydrogenase
VTRAVFADATPLMAAQYDAAAAALLPELVIHHGPAMADWAARLAGADAALVFQTRVSAAMLHAAPALRRIVTLSTSPAGWVDLAAAAARGITVSGVRGYGDRTVAEHALALLLACTRDVAIMDRAIRAGTWQPRAWGELHGKTLAVIGLGGAGREMARLGAALGMQVVGWNRSPVPAGLPCRVLPLDDALAVADAVTLHLALNDSTRGIIDARRLALLRPGAVLVNTARAALVDHAALVAALRAGRLAAAGLDVFDPEPMAPDDPLRALDTVVLTAHAAWLSPEAARRLLHLGLALLKQEA